MLTIEGVLKIRDFGASNILVVNEIPISKFFIEYNGKKINLSIQLNRKRIISYKGIADIYFFEGKYGGSIKYVEDFFINEVDIIEELRDKENESVKMTMNTVWEELYDKISQ